MATYPVIVGGGEGLCCPCPNMSGCNCDSHCRIECRAGTGGEGGTATLCGFSELVDPSVPPKKYRRRTLHNVAPPNFIQCTKRGTDCEEDTLSCPGSICLSYSGPFSGSPDDIEASGCYVFTGIVGGVPTYAAAGVTGRVMSTPPVPLAARIVASPAGGGIIAVSLQVNFIEWTQVASGCVAAGHPSGSKISDLWDLLQDYVQNPASNTCDLTATDNSIRYTGVECTGALLTIGALPCSYPPDCYGGGIGLVGEEPTERVWGGAGCVQGAGDYFTVYDSGGTIAETLASEDTEADAINRALHTPLGVAIPLAPVAFCADNPAFITLRHAGEFTFAFRKVEVRAKLVGLNPALLIDPVNAPCGRASAEYDVRIYIHRRVLGSGLPFLFYAVIAVTAHIVQDSAGTPLVDESITYTPWFEIPNEAGWETRAEYCTAELNSVGPAKPFSLGPPLVCP